MKDKIKNVIIIICLTIILVLGIYIILSQKSTTPKITEQTYKFNETSEIEILKDRLQTYNSSIKSIILYEYIHEVNINENMNLLEKESNKQIFITEYIIANEKSNNTFLTIDENNNLIEDNYPEGEAKQTFLKYADFNKYYESIFGKSFNIKDGIISNTKYDENYVYCPNFRSGLNGLYIKDISINNITYDEKTQEYTSNLTLTYSERLKAEFYKETASATLKYKKAKDQIILTSFNLK